MENPADPVAQSAPSGTSSLPTPLASDVSSPSVIVHRITPDNWKDHTDLDLTLNNWQTWSKHVTLVLQASSGLHLYLLCQVSPRAHLNWEINDAMIRAFILCYGHGHDLYAFSTYFTFMDYHMTSYLYGHLHNLRPEFFLPCRPHSAT